MKQSLFIITILSFFILTGCAHTFDSMNTVKEWEQYQQAKQSINSWVKYVWDKTNDFIENNTWAQKALDSANQKLDKAQEEAIRLKNQAQETAKQYWERAQEEAKHQYGQLKENTKNSVKETINKKVDEAFDKI